MRILLSVACLAAAPLASAQTLFLDLNTAPPSQPSSNPERLFHLAGQTYFAASDSAGQEPWISDGTAGGTHRIANIGKGTGASVPEGFAALPDGRVVFAAYDYSDRELWITDGTESGTSRILDIHPGASASYPISFTSFQGAVYFLADDGIHGRELWRTDGTAAGTTLVRDLIPSATGTLLSPIQTCVSGGFLYYGITAVGLGVLLVKSDGTFAGTTIVKYLNSDTNGSVDQMLDHNGVLLFRARHPTLGSELWRSDGTSAGTFVVKDIAPGGAGSSPSGLFRVGANVVFAAFDPAVGRELFVTDGSATGTGLLANVNPNTSPLGSSSDPVGLGVVGARLVFSAFQPGIGRELFATDGTTPGTLRIADLWPGSSWSSPVGGAVVGGKLFFAANDGVAGIELFTTDGTIGGTQRISDIVPGFDGFPIEQITAAGSLVLFTKNDVVHGEELCVSDGTAAGTGFLLDLFPGALNTGSDPAELTPVGDRMYFTANPDSSGSALYRTDGTAAGTVTVVSASTAPDVSSFATLTPFRDGVFFFGASLTSSLAPYFTNGTTNGTVKLAETSNCFLSDVAVVGDRIVFHAVDGQTFEPVTFLSDGTVAGTVPLTGIVPQVFGTDVEALDDRVLFVASTPATGFELFVTDGTPAGTSLLIDLTPGPTDTIVFQLTRVGDRIYFLANDGIHGTELWVTDGTAAGTHLAADLEPGPDSLSIFSLTPLGDDRIVLQTFDIANGYRLWASDGTAAGTNPIFSVATGEVIDHAPTGDGDVLFFTTRESDGDSHLWRTDGTAIGTSLVPGNGEPLFQSTFATVGTDHEFVVSLSDPATGTELHHTGDGLGATQLVADLAPGILSSTPGEIARLGDRVFISADDGAHGRELHVLPLLDFDSFVAESYGVGCAPSGSPMPTITANGDAVASAPFAIVAGSLPTSAPALVVFGAKSGATSIGFGCVLHVAPPFFSFASATDPSGSLQLPVPPNPGFAGLHAYLQVLASGTGGVVSATPGFELVIGN